MNADKDPNYIQQTDDVPDINHRSATTPSGIGFAAARMSEQWHLIFTEMRNCHPLPINIPEMKTIAEQNNMTVNDQSIRTSLHKFSERRWITRVGMGQYVVADLGIRALEEKASRAGVLLAKLSNGNVEKQSLGEAS